MHDATEKEGLVNEVEVRDDGKVEAQVDRDTERDIFQLEGVDNDESEVIDEVFAFVSDSG